MSLTQRSSVDPPTPIRYGPAGWSYKDWEGIVYPSPAPRGFDPLEYLARWFDTVELNSTFYRPAAPHVARDWARRAAGNPRFRFTWKLWRRFTHERTAWTADELREARAGLEALADEGRLGAILVQFPWSFRATDDNREWLRDVLSAFRDFPRVVELRHASWDTPELLASLAASGVGFVNIDQPLFHDSVRPGARATGAVAYVRVHGRNYRSWFRKDAPRDERYDYLYSADELRPWAQRIRELAENPRTQELYVVTNNHFRGKAPTNALMLQSLVEERQVPGPELLYRAYPEALGPYVTPAPAGVADDTAPHP